MLVQSPKSDIYVVMLAIALASILIACLLMTLVFSRYNFSTKVASLDVGRPSLAGALELARV